MSPHPTEPAGVIRRFTFIAWLLWTVVPALALGALGWVDDYVAKSAGNTDPAGLMATMTADFLMSLLLIPVVTTLQWLILRRAWPKLCWAVWLLVIIISCLGFVAGPLVMMKTGSAFYGAVPPILIIGLAAAVTLSIASPEPLRRFAFAVIFLSFLSGGALVWVMEFYALLLKLSFSINHFTVHPITVHPSLLATLLLHMAYFLVHYHHVLSLACGTAVSGLGLWLASRWASRREAALFAADRP
jgi:hypothetical protein